MVDKNYEERFPQATQAALEETAQRGQAIHDTKLKPLLEPQFNNHYVVIHVDNEDYAVGRTFHDANKIMRSRYPADGRLVGLKIGPEPDDDGFVARILASQLRERAK